MQLMSVKVFIYDSNYSVLKSEYKALFFYYVIYTFVGFHFHDKYSNSFILVMIPEEMHLKFNHRESAFGWGGDLPKPEIRSFQQYRGEGMTRNTSTR